MYSGKPKKDKIAIQTPIVKNFFALLIHIIIVFSNIKCKCIFLTNYNKKCNVNIEKT